MGSQDIVRAEADAMSSEQLDEWLEKLTQDFSIDTSATAMRAQYEIARLRETLADTLAEERG